MVTMEGIRNLTALSMDDLTGVITMYPWFGAARRELCERMSKVGGSEWGKEQYADAAMYIASRTIVSDIVRATRKEDYSDKDVEALLKEYISPAPSAAEPVEAADVSGTGQAPESVYPGRARSVAGRDLSPSREESPSTYRRTVKVVGGDFFSSDQYEQVQQAEDNYFSRFKVTKSDENEDRSWEDPELGFCTETLAWIYADQGYFAEAKKIYSRLMLRYPEKSAYFASLIEKMDKEN